MNPYKTIPNFQKLLAGRHLRFLQFRVLKIKTGDNAYEYLITNLPFSFDLNDIKEIYHWRWGIEVSFRYLKHANGLLHFHCKNLNSSNRKSMPILFSIISAYFLLMKLPKKILRKNAMVTNTTIP